MCGSGAVGVRFLRTQQRVKSQCLYRLGRLVRPGRPVATPFGVVGISLRQCDPPFFVGGCLLGLFPEVWRFRGLFPGCRCLGLDGEFDPGSGRTLAACLTHASRAERPFRGYSSGERVSNT